MDNFISAEQMELAAESLKQDPSAQANDDNLIAKVHTACRTCVFAQYEGLTQTGCKVGRIDQYKEQDGEAVVEAYTLDGGKEVEFYVVNGRLCNLFRDRASHWASEHKDNHEKQARKEVRLKMAFLVYLGEGLTVESLKETAKSIKAQAILPHLVLFINNQSTVKPGEINVALWQTLGNAVTWRINAVVERGENGARVSRERALDIAAFSLPNPAVSKTACATCYAVFYPGFVVPRDFISSIDQAVNGNLDRFRLLTPLEDGNALVCQIWMHQHPMIGGYDNWYGPNGEVISDLVEKVKALSEAHNTPHLYRSVKDVCPSLS